ncbi:hypothetical protein ACO0LB_11090 [Undibacterium sp. SXout7W]|uniref:hypothetical protein n=1 Tax=Undibacterium sp. SXout7W TaxID=3413049 RepID=UPI003BEF65C2
MIAVKPIIQEQWVLDGISQKTPAPEDDALYIKPMLPSEFFVSAVNVHNTLILDLNVFKDLILERRPANNRFLENLFRTVCIEINPTLAIVEQRQKYAKASDDLKLYVTYMRKTFNHEITLENLEEFEADLERGKPSFIENADLLSGYLSAIIYLYHQNESAEKKLEWLAGLILYSDIPIFQLHFYFAGLVFLVKERPELFHGKDCEKVREDMKIASNYEVQKEKIKNLSNDLILPTTSIFQAGINSKTLVFPYVATRDRLCKLFLSQIVCEAVAEAGSGRMNGDWRLAKNSILDLYLGEAFALHFPRRTSIPSRADHLVRKSNVKAFSNVYLHKILALKDGSSHIAN